MNPPSEPGYDIHEKIAQLETELLQHELLIRRQKHVINSLKQMITSPSKGDNSSATGPVPAGGSSSSHIPSAASQVARLNLVPLLSSSSAATSRTVLPPGKPSATTKAATAKAPTAAPAIRNILANRGPAVRQKKRAALAKVTQFLQTLPKFGTDPGPKKRRASTSAVGPILDCPPTAAKKRRRTTDGTESEDDLFSNGVSALLDTARATLRGLSKGNPNAASGTAAGVSVSQSVAPRNTGTSSATLVRPPANTSSSSSAKAPIAAISSGTTIERQVVTTASASKSGAGAGKSTAAPSAPAAVTTAPATATNGAKQRGAAATPAVTAAAAARAANTVRATATTTTASATGTASVVSASASSSTATPVAPSTPQQPTSSSRLGLLSHSNMLGGSAHKALDIVDHCKKQTSPRDRLEIVKDLHASLLSNPRRLQHLLDSAGGRDLCLSWLLQSMDRLSAAYLAASASASTTAGAVGHLGGGDKAALSKEEEVELTKLVEYCVLLINQTLKNLYRLFEFKTEPHHTTVTAIVKSIWPSYRIMRKQFEGRSKDSAVLIQ